MWNWQQNDWPVFKYDQSLLNKYESEFLHQSGFLRGSFSHIENSEKDILLVDLLSDEGLNNSEIEGEHLIRESLQSSIRKNLGLGTDNAKVPLAEQGIAELMVEVYRIFDLPLTDETLFNWHRMVTKGRRDLLLGAYRMHEEPMQVVSGRIDEINVHFEARLLSWYPRK